VLSDGRIMGRREPYAKVFPSSRAVKRAVGPTAWAILEDIALDADLDEQGRLVARTDVRRIADNLGINKNTVSKYLGKLREHGFVFSKQDNSSGTFGGSLYILDPSACIERFTLTPTEPPRRRRPRPGNPRPKVWDTVASVSQNPGHGGAGHDEPGLQQEDVVVSRPSDEEQQQPPQPPSTPTDRPPTQAADLAAQLVELGVTQAVAANLVAEHPAERVRAVLHAARGKRRKNPAGWAVAAFTHGWALDPAPADRDRAAPDPATPGPRPDAAVVAYEQAADAALAGLLPEERAALEEAAHQTVANRLGSLGLGLDRTGDVRAGLVHTELRLLVARQVAIPIPDDVHLLNPTRDPAPEP
jgi:hypothetical protein